MQTIKQNPEIQETAQYFERKIRLRWLDLKTIRYR